MESYLSKNKLLSLSECHKNMYVFMLNSINVLKLRVYYFLLS